MTSDDRPITILHLSDLQFGRYHRFGRLGLPAPDEAWDSLFTRVTDDLKQIEPQSGQPDLVLLTGDLTENGKPSEFLDFLEFASKLAEHLELPRDRVFLVPGNHDVNWDACRAYFHECKSKEQKPTKPYWRKWEQFASIFREFYRERPAISFAVDQWWTLFEIPDLKVTVAGLNSTTAESHLKKDHHGYVGETQLRWFAERLDEYKARGWLRIGALHHNLREGPDDERLRDYDDFVRWLGDKLNLVFHGHTHAGRLDSVHSTLPILATGSAAVTADRRPEEVPNQYQVVQIWPDRFRRFGRLYVPTARRWGGDNRVSEALDNWIREERVQFNDVHATFPKAGRGTPTGAPGRWDRTPFAEARDFRQDRDDFLSRVEVVCRLREGPEARVERCRLDGAGLAYLRVAKREGPVTPLFPVVPVERLTPQGLEGAIGTVHALYRSENSLVTTWVVCGDETVPQETRDRAWKSGVRLVTFAEYQNLIDFRACLRQQTERLANDQVYLPDLYVDQRLTFKVGEREELAPSALDAILEWVTGPQGRFVLVLGDFGTGKTFLLHELARRMGETPDCPVVPVLIEMRELEKGRTLDELVAQHLARAGMERIELRAFRYLLEQGRIALLFDGYDELALRVTYDRAAEHLKTLLEAAAGNAHVIATSRTQHFESDRQVANAVDTIAGHRIARLEPFDRGQIRAFLTRLLGDASAAEERLKLLDEVKDLAGLAQNPRMLSLIAALPAEDLRKAARERGEITAAELYRQILERWLVHEYERAQPGGAPPALTVQDRWNAATQVALRLWRSTEAVSARELAAEVARAAERLAELQLRPEEAAQQVGSGTLLVRDADGRFSFAHQSILEWLVANRAAVEIQTPAGSQVLAAAELSDLMTRFLIELAPREAIIAWSRGAFSLEAPETARRNALRLLRALGQPVAAQRLAGEDLRGRDLSHADLRGADLDGADLSEARMVGTYLEVARLVGARLRRADLSGALLSGADLTRADLSGASLLGADLSGARLAGTVLTRAKLVAARTDPTSLAEADTWGAALPDAATAEPAWASPLAACKALAWSPQHDLLASADGATVRLWDPQGGRELRRLEGHGAPVQALAFSPDGRLLASAGNDRTVRLWDPQGGRELRRLEGHGASVLALAFSPDGRTLASAGDDRTVRLWDHRAGGELRRLEGHGRSVRALAFSPGGAVLASAGNDHTVRLWDHQAGREVRRLAGHEDRVLSLAFSPDGLTVASGDDDRTIRLWDPLGGRELRRLEGHQGRVHALAFSPDGRFLASGGDDGTVRLWDPLGGRELRRLKGHGHSVGALAFSPDGRTLASGGDDGTLRLWGPQAGRELRRLEGHKNWAGPVAFSPDGHLLAAGGGTDGTVRLWDPQAGLELRRLEGHGGWVGALAFSPDGRTLASADFHHALRLWDPQGGHELRRLEGHEGDVAFSPDGRLLASGGRDGTVRLWDPQGSRELRRLDGNRNWVGPVAFSPDSRLLASGGGDGTVRLWDPQTGRELLRLEGHGGGMRAVAFSPDGRLLASGCDDHTVRLWDPQTGRELRRLEGHAGGMRAVAFSPDGRTLASGGDDGTVRHWNPASGRCLAILAAFPEGWVAFLPDGRYKLSGDVAGGFWHVIGLCRFEPGELEPYLPLRLPDDFRFF